MKIKLSKTLAIALALCLTFGGFSAFASAGLPDVEIETSYAYDQAADASVSVTATINNMTEGDEVTYYVSNGDEIVYINQETAPAGGTVVFDTFSAAWNKLTASTVVFGSDAGKSWKGFTFVPAGNYKTNGTATATAGEGNWGVAGSYDSMTGICFTATVTGNYSEYGIRVTQGNETVELPALGCSEEGSYTVFIGADNVDDLAGITAEAYAKQ